MHFEREGLRLRMDDEPPLLRSSQDAAQLALASRLERIMQPHKCIVATCLFLANVLLSCSGVDAQDSANTPGRVGQYGDLPAGFQRVSGRYVDIVTDLPLSPDLRELPEVFDAAVPIWCQRFGLELSEVASWHCDAHIMLERSRFSDAGLIPNNLPFFPYGFQFGNGVWVSEQKSAYYRRHLLLHEGTHWFMSQHYGNNAPPWLMEGMAEWLGTHSWDANNKQLKMGIIPESREAVPYWGRVKIIKSQLRAKTAPSLENILRYGNTAHREVDAYAWSWAAVLFFANHPSSKQQFEKLLELPLRPDPAVTGWFFRQLKQDWPMLRTEWNAMLAELDYGYSPERGMLVASPENLLGHPNRSEFVLDTRRSWQASGFQVQPGDEIMVESTGRYSVGRTTGVWHADANGVTLEYHAGQPIGKLMMAVAGAISEMPDHSETLQEYPIGASSGFTARQSGELHFKINEANRNLADNEGQLEIAISTK